MIDETTRAMARRCLNHFSVAPQGDNNDQGTPDWWIGDEAPEWLKSIVLTLLQKRNADARWSLWFLQEGLVRVANGREHFLSPRLTAEEAHGWLVASPDNINRLQRCHKDAAENYQETFWMLVMRAMSDHAKHHYLMALEECRRAAAREQGRAVSSPPQPSPL